MVVTVISAPFTMIFPFIRFRLHSDLIVGQFFEKPLTPRHVASKSPVYHGSATSPGRSVWSVLCDLLRVPKALFVIGELVQ